MLNKSRLGNTNLNVTEYCLGALPMGPNHKNLSEKDCIELINIALDNGVNFIDTAERYGTEGYIGKAVANRREEIVIATKSWAKTYDEMAKPFEKSLKELNTDYIDIYHLHAGRADIDVLDHRKGALEFLLEMKEQQVIKAVGISTHSVGIVKKAAEREEIDIVFPLINKTGLGIVDGSKKSMLEAINKASKNGKGIYAMKALGGGNLLNDIKSNIDWVRSIKGISSIAIGVVTPHELKYNLKLFGVDKFSEVTKPDNIMKKLHILKWNCIGCNQCVDTCPNYAISLVDGVATVDRKKCILCGYCSPGCPKFAIRLV